MSLVPDDRFRLASNVAWIALVLLYFWPGGMLLSGYETEIAGWPVFALWTVLVGPALVLLLYGVNAYRNIQQARDEAERDTSVVASGGD